MTQRYREIDALGTRKEILKQLLLLLLGEFTSFTGMERHWIRDTLEKAGEDCEVGKLN
jgi:hypothetical protein